MIPPSVELMASDLHDLDGKLCRKHTGGAIAAGLAVLRSRGLARSGATMAFCSVTVLADLKLVLCK